VLLPFLLTIDIAQAHRRAGADTVICSAFAADAHNGSGKPGSDAHAAGCLICTMLAAAQGFTAPPAIVLPQPRAGSDIRRAFGLGSAAMLSVAGAYRSRAPPANA
jgi:hypothetical protein